jgi:hypothetical protein
MNDDRPKRDTMSIEEATISNMRAGLMIWASGEGNDALID